MKNQLVEFEYQLDDLIKSELKDVTEEEVRNHFYSVTIFEHIKLVMWSTRE